MKTETRFFEDIRITEKNKENFVYYKRLSWTTEKPTKSGYYWAKIKDKRCRPTITMIEIYGKDCYTMGDEVPVEEMNIFTHFMGPLAIPEMPQ
jgi:hypothetical protein